MNEKIPYIKQSKVYRNKITQNYMSRKDIFSGGNQR